MKKAGCRLSIPSLQKNNVMTKTIRQLESELTAYRKIQTVFALGFWIFLLSALFVSLIFSLYPLGFLFIALSVTAAILLESAREMEQKTSDLISELK